MRELVTTILFGVVLVVAAPALAQGLTAQESRLLELVNGARAEAGLPPVTADLNLTGVARSHSRDMAESRFFAHRSPLSGSPGDRLRAASIPFRLSGENIAFDQSVAEAHQAFLASPSHRRNVLDSEFTHVGIGIVSTGHGLYVTQNFIRPRPEFVASAPPTTSALRPEAEGAPHSIGSSPPPHSLGHRDRPVPLTGPAPGVGQASPPFQPAPFYGAVAQPPLAQPPLAQPSLAQPPVGMPPVGYGPGVWVAGPGGSWQLVPAPWPVALYPQIAQ